MVTPRAPGESRFSEILRRLTDDLPGRRLLADLADAILHLLDGERVFMFRFRKVGGFRVLVGRNVDGDDISQPQERMSHYAVGKMEKRRGIWLVSEARIDRRYRSEDSLAGRKPPRSIVLLPLEVGGELLGGIYADHRFQVFGDELVRADEVQSWVNLCSLALAFREKQTRTRWLEKRLEKARRIGGARLHASAAGPPRRPRVAGAGPGVLREFEGFYSANTDVLDLFDDLQRISSSSIPVLVNGETGVGKNCLARAIHLSSSRAEQPFVVLSCGAVPDGLVESELLGHVKGAFTGAEADRVGVFAQAHGGTLYLDEVADMSLAMQTKLLCVLQDGLVRPVGAKEANEVDVRIVSSTGHDIERLVAEGRFRRDLYFRLKSFTAEIPPLRERWEDIQGLAELFLARYTRTGRVPGVDQEAMDRLVSFDWPGNVRELENELRRLAALGYEEISIDRLSPFLLEGSAEWRRAVSRGSSTRALDEVVSLAEREAVLAALRRHRGNKSKAAEALGITRKALYRRLARYGMGPQDAARADRSES